MLTAIKRYNVDSMGLMTIAGTETFSYDAMGNPTSYASKTLTWSGKQLTRYYYHPNKNELYDYTYAYDENGLRTQKVVNGVTTSYYYNGSLLMGMVTGSGNSAVHQLFSYDSSGNVVSVDYSSNGGSTFTTYYYLRNAQNDIVKIIDGNGATVVEYKYDSWGKLLSTTGSMASTLGANQPFRYRGYVYDAETGWYYLQSRYYDPSIARFISADVYLSTGQGVLGHNSYAYCGNNPLVRIDNNGYFWELLEKFIAVISALVIVGPEIRYDVPMYNQGSYNLRWAYSQTMIESYQTGQVLTQEQADMRAQSIAKSVHGSSEWNKGGWPTNILSDGKADVCVDSIYDLYYLLYTYGPVYAYYRGEDSAHMVVVTGVDLQNEVIFTNNPWGIKGEQTFYEFLNGFAGMGTSSDLRFNYCLFPLRIERMDIY